jgi:hypothetical protein
MGYFDAPGFDAPGFAVPDEQLVEHTTAAIHEFESRLQRPLSAVERDQLAAAVASDYGQAAADADQVLERFDADLFEQTELLERDLGRKLLQHEFEGIREQGHHALSVRGEALDAQKAWSDYWRHRGEKPPDMTNEYEAAEHMAARAAEMAAHAAAEAEATPQPAAPSRDEVQAEFEARKQAQLAAAATVPMRHPNRDSITDAPAHPDWANMSEDQINAALAARVAGLEYTAATGE